MRLLTSFSVKQCADKLPEDSEYLSIIQITSYYVSQFKNKIGPRYCMGIGFAEGRFIMSSFLTDLGLIRFTDLLVCVALGIDMVCHFHNLLSFHLQLSVFTKADCVFPTRTARFGVALTYSGPMNLRKISADAPCSINVHNMSRFSKTCYGSHSYRH